MAVLTAELTRETVSSREGRLYCTYKIQNNVPGSRSSNRTNSRGSGSRQGTATGDTDSREDAPPGSKRAPVTTTSGSFLNFLPRRCTPCEALVLVRSRPPVVGQATASADLLRKHRRGGQKPVPTGSSRDAAKRGRRHCHLHGAITCTKHASYYCCLGGAAGAAAAAWGARGDAGSGWVGLWASCERSCCEFSEECRF